MNEVLLQVLKFGRDLLALKGQVAQNTAEIKDIRGDLKELTEAVRDLAYQVKRNHENDAHEREKLLLKVENYLLRYVKKLPHSEDG